MYVWPRSLTPAVLRFSMAKPAVESRMDLVFFFLTVTLRPGRYRKHAELFGWNSDFMAMKILSLMLVVTQFMSWTAAPLHLCISKSGSVCVEFGDEHCTCCCDTDRETPACPSPACCDNCEADKSDDQPVAALTHECDCTHLPLMMEQDDSIRTESARGQAVGEALISWLPAPQAMIPSSIGSLILHWDRRTDPSRHPIAQMTTVLRC